MRILQSLLRTKYNSIINNYFASNANKIYKTNKNKRGLIVRFNGLELGRTPQIFPILTMAAYTYGAQQIIRGFISKDASNIKVKDVIPSVLLALPISGAMNNLTWKGSAFSGATNELNYRLVTENPNVDVFLNPKYIIDYHIGFWKQTALFNRLYNVLS